MNRLFCSIVLSLITWCGIGTVAHAEFLKLGALTYASPSGRTFVIAARAISKSGFFIVHFDEPVSLQEFRLEELEIGKARTAFITINQKTGGYDKLLLADGKEYPIQGAVTIKIGTKGQTRIAIDNQFLTVVSEMDSSANPETQKPQILGFSGLESLFNLGGIEAVALLEANQLQQKAYRDVIATYEVDAANKLVLSGKEFSGTRIGVTSEQSAPCSASAARIYAEEDLSSSVLEKDDDARRKALQELSRSGKPYREFDSFILLSILSKLTAVAMDPETGSFVMLKIVDSEMPKQCVFRKLKL